MAKPIDDRIASALKPGSRLADCEALLLDIRAEREAVTAARAAADDRRSDPMLSEAEAIDANIEFEEAALRLRRLDRAEASLGAAIASKKDAERSAEYEKRWGQIKARRDKLAEELREKVGPALAIIAEYNHRIIESDREVAEANKMPLKREQLQSAEQVARGYAGHAWGAYKGVVVRLTDLRLPHFDRDGSAWPDTEADNREREAAAARTRAAMRKATADREASKKRYYVRRMPGLEGDIILFHAEGKEKVFGATIDCTMYPEQADAARSRGLSVIEWSPEAAAAEKQRLAAYADA